MAALTLLRDRHALYEASVQGVDYDLDFAARKFQTLRGRPARVMREDFCGTAALSCGWVLRSRENVAYGVDLDPEPLAWAREHRLPRLNGRDRVHLVRGNVLNARTPRADVTLAHNFSFWVFKTRPQLLAYFRAAWRALKADGVLVLSMYGGTESFEPAIERRRIPSQQAVDGTRLPAFRYIWDQERFNPLTHEVFCSISFKVPGKKLMKRAFTYDWRLWTLPEVLELLAEAGFRESRTYVDTGSGVYHRRTRFENQPGWLAIVVGIK